MYFLSVLRRKILDIASRRKINIFVRMSPKACIINKPGRHLWIIKLLFIWWLRAPTLLSQIERVLHSCVCDWSIGRRCSSLPVRFFFCFFFQLFLLASNTHIYFLIAYWITKTDFGHASHMRLIFSGKNNISFSDKNF